MLIGRILGKGYKYTSGGGYLGGVNRTFPQVGQVFSFFPERKTDLMLRYLFFYGGKKKKLEN